VNFERVGLLLFMVSCSLFTVCSGIVFKAGTRACLRNGALYFVEYAEKG